MKVIHPYSDARLEEQKETLKVISTLNNVSDIKVIDFKCINHNDYEEFLKSVGEQDTLIILEQDIVPTIDMLIELQNCPYDWCAYEYSSDNSGSYSITHGFGLTKFSLNAQKRASPKLWKSGTYRDLDARVTGWLSVLGWHPHIHGKVKHNHKEDVVSQQRFI